MNFLKVLTGLVQDRPFTNQGAGNLAKSPDCPADTMSALWYLLGANVPQDVVATLIAREPDLSIINACEMDGTFLAIAAGTEARKPYKC